MLVFCYIGSQFSLIRNRDPRDSRTGLRIGKALWNLTAYVADAKHVLDISIRCTWWFASIFAFTVTYVFIRVFHLPHVHIRTFCCSTTPPTTPYPTCFLKLDMQEPTALWQAAQMVIWFLMHWIQLRTLLSSSYFQIWLPPSVQKQRNFLELHSANCKW